MVGYALAEVSEEPQWLESLLTDRFFEACSVHEDFKKNETNVFCITCTAGICQHCLPRHRSHRLLQVRRYVYHDVIRLQDIQKLMECSYVQTYIINSARVVFIKQRPQSRPAKGFTNSCRNCERSLQESYLYCSITCKVKFEMRSINNGHVKRCCPPSVTDIMDYTIGSHGHIHHNKLHYDGLFCPNSVLEAGQLSSGSSTSTETRAFALTSTATMNIISADLSISMSSGPTAECGRKTKRRKGVPRRSPIY